VRALVALSLVSLALLAGVLVYVAVSYAHLQAHAPARRRWATLREIAREIGWALLVLIAIRTATNRWERR